MPVAVKVAISIFVNELNAKSLKSSKTQFQFQFELSLAQFSPSLFLFNLYISNLYQNYYWNIWFSRVSIDTAVLVSLVVRRRLMVCSNWDRTL